MSEFQIQMPKIGESVQEATIIQWFVKEGDSVEEDDLLFEIASDKVDSEIPSPVAGILKKILHQENDVVAVGEMVAIIEMESNDYKEEKDQRLNEKEFAEKNVSPIKKEPTPSPEKHVEPDRKKGLSNRFYSPLVKKIAREESVSMDELEAISGSGLNGRVQKQDLLTYLEKRKTGARETEKAETQQELKPQIAVSIGAEDQIIQMDRVRRLIAEHMVYSKRVAPHVTTFVEADVSEMVIWRNQVKNEFLEKYQEKLTFMPLFTEVAAKALREFPFLNASVDGDRIILRKQINIGMAVATSGNKLFVPVVKNADHLNLSGLAAEINRLANAGRTGKLKPEELQGGTFTITNFGSFGNLGGTPIINQPQVAILAVGAIVKKPAVVETSTGDAIVVRHKMMLSLSYDHRIVDGAMGGAFLRRVADLFESFNPGRTI